MWDAAQEIILLTTIPVLAYILSTLLNPSCKKPRQDILLLFYYYYSLLSVHKTEAQSCLWGVSPLPGVELGLSPSSRLSWWPSLPLKTLKMYAHILNPSARHGTLFGNTVFADVTKLRMLK